MPSQAFTIQSVSKPFMYGYALQHYGRDLPCSTQVGVEPTGEAFNSIVLDEVANRPFNPMVNAGAIAVAELMLGDTQAERIANMLALFSDLAGRELEHRRAGVPLRELATGHRNRAIAYMMLNTAMIRRDPNEVLDLYFRQCSVNVTCRDLAIMAATLANDGKNPLTGKAVFDAQYVRDVLSVMNSCGMYDYAGEWAYEVGMPAKSGVSGCIIAVIPGQIGICVFSPPIDTHGNSVRGIRVCQEISNEFELHAFNNRTNVRSVIRRDYRADVVRSNRLRTPEERKVLAKEGAPGGGARGARAHCSSARPSSCCAGSRNWRPSASYVVVDFKRVHLRRHRGAQADRSARRAQWPEARPSSCSRRSPITARSSRSSGDLIDRKRRGARARCSATPTRRSNGARTSCSPGRLRSSSGPKFAVSELDLFKGLKPAECRLIESIVRPLVFEKGEVIIREGDEAKLFFVLARGTVSVRDQGARPGAQEEARGLDRTRAQLRRDGAARRRQALGRHRRR